MGTPSEQVGFQASEEYASRMSSPRPQSTNPNKSQSSVPQYHIDSPLRNDSTPTDANAVSASLRRSLQSPDKVESEQEDDDTIHVDDPSHRVGKIYGGAGHMESTESLGQHGEVTEDESDYIDEHGYSAPILASDEVAKEPFASWDMQPAVSPKKERSGAHDQDFAAHHRSGSASSLSSRPSSRPGSIHGGIAGMRDTHSTPLEDLNEYEPLFPEDDKEKPSTVADRLKRPELKNRKFPSQDIWEDTPNSLQYTATVSTPQLPEDQDAEGPIMKNLKVRANETPAQAFARRQEELAESESSDSGSFLNSEKRPWAKATAIPTHLAHETRPSMKQRFPSRDIWEDSPDSLQLQTTVSGPQASEADTGSPLNDRSATAPVSEKPVAETDSVEGLAASMRPHIPARPNKAKSSEPSNDSNKASAPPSIPERPAQKKNIIPPAFAAKPTIPDRSKPIVPTRPSKFARETSQESLTRVTSGGSAKSQISDTDQNASIAASKPKPPVPSRPMGSKIAALQGGFMSDLNKRLQLGPMVPKKEEPKPAEEEVIHEKAPLTDARKGRARGPVRRAPAKSPEPTHISTALPDEVAEKLASLGFPVPTIQWTISLKDGSLTITPQQAKVPEVEAVKATESSTPTVETNISSEEVHARKEVTSEPEKVTSPVAALEDHQAMPSEDLPKEPSPTTEEKVMTLSSPVKSNDDTTHISEHESLREEEGADVITAFPDTVNPSTESKEELSLAADEEEPKTSHPISEAVDAENEVEKVAIHVPEESDVIPKIE